MQQSMETVEEFKQSRRFQRQEKRKEKLCLVKALIP